MSISKRCQRCLWSFRCPVEQIGGVRCYPCTGKPLDKYA